jgi:hypothetical protein
MKTILDTDNIFEYLARLNYCDLADRATSQMTIIDAKNFNVLVALADGRKLLVKQELHNDRGQTKGEFWSAWQMQQLMVSFPNFGNKIGGFLPEILYFDPDNSILIVKYLAEYGDLYRYYTTENYFPTEVARSIGQLLATIHSKTFKRSEYQQFFSSGELQKQSQQQHLTNSHSVIDLIDRLTRITPQIFRMIPLECLQFFRLYQRFPNLSAAIIELGNSIAPSCVVHHDLKVNNILLDLDWQQPGSTIIRLIDWERAGWGDPAFDLGSLLGSYLEIWLDGLMISNNLSINESLQLAATPLELLQPSLFNLVDAYLELFPTISILRPEFLNRSIQFAGLALIQRVESTLYEDRIFDNRGIVIMQVAKQLICTPQAAMNTLFGSNSTHLITN